MKEESKENEAEEKEINQEITEKPDELAPNPSKEKVLGRFPSIFKTSLRISDTLINILTVSFGVLLATFLNYLVSSYNEKKEAEQFLAGLYFDLEKDRAELINDLASFKNSSKGFSYYYRLNAKEEFEEDSIKKHQNFIYNYVLWFPNAGRFEGFKSSGKIYYIENETLRNEILDFYQETAPVLVGVSTYYNSQSERLRIYIEEADTSTGIEELLLKPKGKIILLKCMALQKAIVEMYEKAIRKTEKIMHLIKEKEKS